MELTEMERLYLVGLPVRAGWRDLWSEMPKTWRLLFERASEIDHRRCERFVDASLEVEDGQYLQLVGAEVVEVGHVPDGMMAVEIPVQRWIHERHHGPTPNIAKSFGMIYDWAKARDHRAAKFKLDIGYTPEGNEVVHDLYVAIHPTRGWKALDAS